MEAAVKSATTMGRASRIARASSTIPLTLTGKHALRSISAPLITADVIKFAYTTGLVPCIALVTQDTPSLVKPVSPSTTVLWPMEDACRPA